MKTNHFSVYTLSDLGVLSHLIGSLSLANEHYSPPNVRTPNKNKMAGVNSRFASVLFLFIYLFSYLVIYLFTYGFVQAVPVQKQ